MTNPKKSVYYKIINNFRKGDEMNLKKVAAVLSATALAISVFSACTGDNIPGTENTESTENVGSVLSQTSSQKLQDLMSSEGNENEVYAAISFIGYVNEENSLAELKSYVDSSSAALLYPFLKDIPTSSYVSTGGAELYAIVPKNENYTVAVYGADLDSDGKYSDSETPLYTGQPGEAVIVCCNISEVYSDAFVSVTKGKGIRSVRLTVSLENGQLVKAKGFFDFSNYDNGDIINDVDVQERYLTLTEYQQVKEYTDSGYALVYQNETENINGFDCLIYSLGTYYDEDFIPEIDYAVGNETAYIFDGEAWSELEKN